MPTLNDFKNLALLLPPNLRVAGSEVADVVSALAAYTQHGDALLQAAENGAQDVADFFHNHISENAPEGAPEPVKGNAVETVASKPGAPAQPAGVNTGDLARFKQEVLGDIKTLLADVLGGNAVASAPAETTPPVVDPAAAPADAPASVEPPAPGSVADPAGYSAGDTGTGVA